MHIPACFQSTDSKRRAVAKVTTSGTPSLMNPIQRLPAWLTPLDTALAALLSGIGPVKPVALPLVSTLGLLAAEMPPPTAHPQRDTAARDGWAMRACDLVGASSYSPLPLSVAPVWVETGDAIPLGCDCVVDVELLDQAGPMLQALAEAIPGQGIRRQGSEIAGGSPAIPSGRRVRALDLLIARAAGLQQISVRRPLVRVVDVPAVTGEAITKQLISEIAHAAGAEVVVSNATGREAAAIAKALDAGACDLIVTIGGSGVGRRDATVTALASCGGLVAHGIALQPGRTAAVGKIGNTPVIALPGAADQALAAWWTLALPVVERLSGLRRSPVALPLMRKIASSVGIAEVVLLEKVDGQWLPLAVGELSLDAIARANARLVLSAESEGHAAGDVIDAYMLRD
jgi:molybdopterin molybdotransferase